MFNTIFCYISLYQITVVYRNLQLSMGIAVVRFRPSAGRSFIKISQFLHKLSLAQTDARTDRHPDYDSPRHRDHLYVLYNNLYLFRFVIGEQNNFDLLFLLYRWGIILFFIIPFKGQKKDIQSVDSKTPAQTQKVHISLVEIFSRALRDLLMINITLIMCHLLEEVWLQIWWRGNFIFQFRPQQYVSFEKRD